MEKEFTDINSYNKNMAKPMDDKLFFLEKIDWTNNIIVDFGCADGRVLAEIKNRLEKIRQTIEKIQIEECPNMQITMSFGAVYGEGLVKDMFSAADKLLYESKNIRNTITIRPFL